MQATTDSQARNLIETISTITDVPGVEQEKLCGMVRCESLRKGEVFIRAGTVPQKFAFVDHGLFRYYYMNDKGAEFTKGFFPERSFITSYTAMTRQTPSYYTIEALEDSHILVIPYEHWLQLYRGHPCWTSFLLALLHKGYSKKEARERELLLLSAEERYRIFLQEHAYLENRVRQHMIASYLGITPVALSRIRRSMSL